MRPELEQLIADMNDHRILPESEERSPAGQTVGFYAYRAAERWDDPADFAALVAYLQGPAPATRKGKKDDDEADPRRTAVYTIAISLLAKFPELGVSAVLGALLRETDVMLVESAVSRMMRLEIPFTEEGDVDALLTIGQSRNAMLRTRVWDTLRNSRVCHEKIEARLLEVLAGKPDDDELESAAAALQTTGSARALPKLKALMEARRGRVTLSPVIKAIADIGGKDEAAYLLTQLEHQNNAFLKSAIAERLALIDDACAVPALIKRAKQILAKKRTMMWSYAEGQLPELVHVLQFLQRHADADAKGVAALFAWIRAGKLDHLHREEAAWFSAQG